MNWVLFTIAALLTLAGYIWLTVLGFKRSLLWGFLVLLFSPLSALIFAVLNWRETRVAFIFYAVSTVLFYGALHSVESQYKTLIQQTASNKLQEQQGVDTSSQADSAENDMGNGNNDNGAVDTGANPSPAESGSQPAQQSAAVKSKPTPAPIPDLSKVQPDPLAQKKLKLPPKTILISMSRISHYVGRYFIIKLKNGEERRGLLTKVTASRLYLIRKLYGGDLKFSLHKYEVKSLNLLREPPKER